MSLVAITAIILVASIAVIAGPGIRNVPRSTITEADKNNQSTLTGVNGLRSCGGPGQVVEWRLEGCSGEGICQLEGNGKIIKSEFEFVPSHDVDKFVLRIDLVIEGEVEDGHEQVIPDSAVQTGKTYIVHGIGAFSKELQGKTVTLKYLLYNFENSKDEVCGEADFQIV